MLLRPDTYVGSLEEAKSSMWIWDRESGRMMEKDVVWIPGLFKIYDEIIEIRRIQ